METEVLCESSEAPKDDGSLPCTIMDVWVSEIKDTKETEYVISFPYISKPGFLFVMPF